MNSYFFDNGKDYFIISSVDSVSMKESYNRLTETYK